MSLKKILAAIPHREPFLLLDEIVEQDESHIVCRKTFRGDEYFYAGHYPDYPITPGVLLCEAAMQAGAVLLSQLVADLEGERVPVATRMNNVRFKKMVSPGETVELNVRLTERMADAFFLVAKVTTAGKTAVTFDFACTMAKKTVAS